MKGSPKQFVMDSVKDIDSLGHDLRDDESGRLDAKKIAVLFGISVPDIAEAAGVSRQALDKTPASVRRNLFFNYLSESLVCVLILNSRKTRMCANGSIDLCRFSRAAARRSCLRLGS